MAYDPFKIGPPDPNADQVDELGIPIPGVQDAPDEQFSASPVDVFLERLQGLQNIQGRPRGFGQGLLLGLAQGAGTRGTRVATARERFIQRQDLRRKQIDDANRKATEEYQKTRTNELLGRQKEQRQSQSELDKENRKLEAELVPIDERTVARFPQLGPWQGEKLPRETFNRISQEKPRPATSRYAPGGEDHDTVTALADGIENGTLPPDTKGMYRLAGPLKAELARRGYDFVGATKDWQAVQRNINSLNGPQQTRLRQAVDTAYHSLDVIDELSARLEQLVPRGSIAKLNSAQLAVIRNSPGEAGSVARQLEGQITDLVSELGNAYMGGNSPTDHALKLAANNLSGNWSYRQLKDMVNLSRRNLSIRRNSIYNTTPIVPGQSSPAPSAAPVVKWTKDAQGNPVPVGGP